MNNNLNSHYNMILKIYLHKKKNNNNNNRFNNHKIIMIVMTYNKII